MQILQVILNVSSTHSPMYVLSLINIYFDDNTKIKNSMFKQVFISLRSKQLVKKDDFVKLCLIYFIEYGILGKENQVNINIDHFSMIEDLEYFNRYLWD